MTFDELRAWREVRIAKEPGPRFMGLPDRWFNVPHWRCQNGHVTTHYIKSEAEGAALCLGCYAPVLLTYPEDKDGPPAPNTDAEPT